MTNELKSYKLDFEGFASGTVMDDEYAGVGVHISSGNDHKPPMIFDTDNPTGGDYDLATDNLGNVLIISEDGDSQDPDDNAHGGKLYFDFDDAVVADSITVLDVEECARVRLFDENGNLIGEFWGQTGNNGQQVIDLGDTAGVARMEVTLFGSGAIDNVSFKAPDRDDLEVIARDDTAETDEDTPVVIDVLANDSAESDDDEEDDDEDEDDEEGDDEDEDDEEGDDEDEDDEEGDDEDEDDEEGDDEDEDDEEGDDEDEDDEEGDDEDEDDEEGDDEDEDDEEGDVQLTVIAASSPDGEVIINDDGTLTFIPDENFNGETTITYTIEGEDDEGDTDTDTATVHITVNPVNDDPVAADDSAVTDEDTDVVIDVLDNDSDVDGDPLDVTEATSADGSVDILPDGSLRFTPDANFNGETTITYTVDDGNGGTDTATVTVTVNPVNDDPVANDDSDTTDFNTAVVVDLLDNDTDVDGDDLTVTGASVPASEGTLTDNGGGKYTFTPAAGFTGVATISYTISDGNGGTDSAVHTVEVGAAPLDGTVEGTAGNDVIDHGYLGDPEGDRVDNEDAILPGAAPNDDLIYGFGGDDTIRAGQGDDEVYGGDGNDSISGQGGNDTLVGNAGEDIIIGGKDDDLIRGGDDNDTLDGRSGDDTVFGGDGDDLVIGGGGNDTLDGGKGDDTILGDNNEDVITGGQGDDTIEAGASDDTVDGGIGSDSIDGGAGDDIINAGNHVNPLPDVGYPGIYGADSDPDNDKDIVDGGAGDDIITTGDDDDTITGGTGNDIIDGGFDDDSIEGNEGDDTIIGGEGNDEIDGGDGDDLIYGGLDDSAPDLVNIPDDGSGPLGPDLVTDNNNDVIDGGAGNDTIFGRDDDDTLLGGTGDDYLDGGVDDDVIEGGDGDDIIIGGQGNDDLSGGFGSDTFLGGNGGDVVVGGEDPDDGDVDVLDLTGSNVDFITYVDGDPEAGTVTFLDGSTMTFSEIENVIPCFTPGTTIATPRGERLVEDLREGDRIITRDNGIQEIRWVGHKQMKGTDLARNPHLKPILIKAGALGNGLPERDMLVSPNHRVLVANDKTQLYFEENEVLASAKHLVGSQGIHAVDIMATAYIHFMFDNHEVVLSNGAWTESFQPGDYSLKGIGNAQRTELFELFPELRDQKGREGYAAARRSLKKHEARLLVK